MMSKKTIFIIIWLILLSLGPITVIRNTPELSINFFQRMFGLWAFTLLFIQIILGAFMQKLTEKLGGWVFKFHITEGLFAYALVFSHPLLFAVLNYQTSGVFNPFYVYLGFSLKDIELFYSFGRSAFWLMTLAVVAALLRTQPWLQNNWRKFHILNYFVFFAVWYHSFKVGTDIGTFPFSFFHGPSLIIVLGIVLYRLFSYFKSLFTSPSRSGSTSPNTSTRRE